MIDLFLIMGGCGFSLLLASTNGLTIASVPEDKRVARFMAAHLPELFRLCEGVILLWPVFYFTQQGRGRMQELTSGEWLWVFAFMGIVLIDGFDIARAAGWFNPLGNYSRLPPFVWYMILVPAMALVGMIIALVGLLARWQTPWTHQMGLVLIIWPVIPLIVLFALGLEFEQGPAQGAK